MKSSEIIIFFPSIEKGGADKNLFTISNYLATKLPNVSVLTSSNKYKSSIDRQRACFTCDFSTVTTANKTCGYNKI